MAEPSRYLKQMRVAAIGDEGQAAIDAARVLIVGVGALGSTIADQLVRAGVGTVRVVDRDLVEHTNLQRQTLYTEADASAAVPKATAAADRLRQVNSDITIEAFVEDATPSNIERLATGCDLLIDGTDNLETRYLLNDLAWQSRRPWVYGGCVGTFGQAAALIPNRTPCWRCLFPEPPPADAVPTCDTAGVLGPAVQLIASIESTLVLKLLVAGADEVDGAMHIVDPWDGVLRRIQLASPIDDCLCCQRQQYEWLSGSRCVDAVALCGRNAVQIAASGGFDLAATAERLRAEGEISGNRFLTRWTPAERGDWQVTLFPDGRTIIEGTDDVGLARAFHARFIGA